MKTMKPWYLSRTIWAALVTILTGAAGLAGASPEQVDETALTDALQQGVGAIAGLVALFGRLSATDRIG